MTTDHYKLTDDDKLVYVTRVLKGKLLESSVLRQQAANNTKEQFGASPDLDLLRGFEPIIRYNDGELFFPSSVEGYLAECDLLVIANAADQRHDPFSPETPDYLKRQLPSGQ